MIFGFFFFVIVNDGEDGFFKIYDVSVIDVESDFFLCFMLFIGIFFNY